MTDDTAAIYRFPTEVAADSVAICSSLRNVSRTFLRLRGLELGYVPQDRTEFPFGTVTIQCPKSDSLCNPWRGGARVIESTRNSLAVLEAIHDAEGEGVTAIAEATGLAKSTVHDHVETLVELGYVVRTDGGLQLSYRFLGFGLDIRRRTRASAEAEAKVAQLAERTGERAHYIVEEGGESVFLFSETGENAVETDVSPGNREPLPATASGTAILAHLPEERIDAIVAAIDFGSVGRASIADESDLRAELDRVRSAGVAYNEGEYIRNLWSASAPVLDGEDRLLGSMSVSAPVHRLQHEGVRDDLTATLLETVNELELDIAYA